MSKIDLHIHSTCSDGKWDVEQIIDYCSCNDVRIISITDHDTIEGVKHAVEYGKNKDVKVIPGIEFSADWKEPIHILGYNIDINSDELHKAIGRIKSNRTLEFVQLIKKLKQLGINIDAANIKNQKSLGIESLSELMVEYGYANSWQEAAKKYFYKGGLAYVPKWSLDCKCVIDLIKSVGGISVWAHPGRNLKISSFYSCLDELIEMGIQGVEVFSPYNKEQQEINNYCNQKDLLFTGGSDFHNGLYDNIGKLSADTEIPNNSVSNEIKNLTNTKLN